MSGRVIRGTEIACGRDDDDDDNRSRGRGDDDDDDNRSRGRGRDGDDRACSGPDLTEGARVRKAELHLSGRGQTWDEVVLAG